MQRYILNQGQSSRVYLGNSVGQSIAPDGDLLVQNIPHFLLILCCDVFVVLCEAVDLVDSDLEGLNAPGVCVFYRCVVGERCFGVGSHNLPGLILQRFAISVV